MRVELKRLHERLETTAIYVTHDQVEAMTLGDRIVVMKDGWVQQVGEPLDLYGKPANKFVAGFIGSPAMNFVDVSVSDLGGRCGPRRGLRLHVPASSRTRCARTPASPDARRAAGGAARWPTARTRPTTASRPRWTWSSRSATRSFVNFRVGGAPMVARVDPAVRVKVHESIRVVLDPERVHFFDEKSGAAI